MTPHFHKTLYPIGSNFVSCAEPGYQIFDDVPPPQPRTRDTVYGYMLGQFSQNQELQTKITLLYCWINVDLLAITEHFSSPVGIGPSALFLSGVDCIKVVNYVNHG